MNKKVLPTKFLPLLVVLFFFSFLKIYPQAAEPFSINNSPLPAPSGFINDYAGVIDAATKQNLERKIQALKDKTNPPVEIGVAVVKTTGERPIFDYSLAVARGWKIGAKDGDNPGALLLVAIEDRKYYTQISRNLEDELPDGLAGQLQRQYLVPEFKKGNYAKGISDTIDAYIKTIEERQSGQPVAANQKRSEERGAGISICNMFFCLIILFILMLFIFGGSGRSRRNRNDRDRWGGGGGFGGGGGSILPWIIGTSIANDLNKSSGGWGGGSSDWGGSSGGWGGFGGGGDFGGGGAGGDW